MLLRLCRAVPAAARGARDRRAALGSEGGAHARGSVIIDPQGNVLAGPYYHEEGLLTAEINMDDIIRARYDLDVSGHYARPDIFQLKVDTRRKLNTEEMEH